MVNKYICIQSICTVLCGPDEDPGYIEFTVVGMRGGKNNKKMCDVDIRTVKTMLRCIPVSDLFYNKTKNLTSKVLHFFLA